MAGTGSSPPDAVRRTARTRAAVAVAVVVVAVALVLVITRQSSDQGAGAPQQSGTGVSSGQGQSGQPGQPGQSGSPEPSTAPTSVASASGPSATPSRSAPARGGPGARPSASPATGEAARPRNRTVALRATSDASRGILVRVSRLEWVRGKAVVPGEGGGDALRVTVSVTNRSDRTVRLPATVVNLYYGPDRTPGGPLREPGSAPFPQQVDPGRTVQGVFVFEVPQRPRVRVEVEVDLDHRLRIVTFAGRPLDAS